MKFTNLKCWDIVQREFRITDIEVTDSKKLFSSSDKEIDCSGLIGIPSGIDIHVHFREPGLEHKEDMLSGSLAALHGGVTTVLDMANNQPVTDSTETISMKKKLAQKQNNIEILIAAAITNKNHTEINKIDEFCDAYKIFLPEFEGELVVSDENIFTALSELEKIGSEQPIIIQAEDQEIISRYRNELSHKRQRPQEAETIAFQKIFNWAKEFPSLKFHATLLSSSLTLKMLEMANLSNLTTDTSYRYLLFDEESIIPDYSKKVNPPFRTSIDKDLILQALSTGLIDIVCSDHAPHTLEEKETTDPSGIPGIQELLPTLISLIQNGELEWERAIEAFHSFPANLLNLASSEHNLDSLVILDSTSPFNVTKDWIKTKVKWSILEGKSMYGKVKYVVKNGDLALKNA